jgi:hypothetical protein
MSTPPPATPPSQLELIAALVPLLRPPAPPASPAVERGDLTRTIVGGIVATIGAVALALIFWVGTSVSGLSTAVTKMGGNVEGVQKAIADLQATQGSTSTQLSDGKAVNAKQDARADAQEADMNRVKERVRILEGQKPLGLGRPAEPF